MAANAEPDFYLDGSFKLVKVGQMHQCDGGLFLQLIILKCSELATFNAVTTSYVNFMTFGMQRS